MVASRESGGYNRRVTDDTSSERRRRLPAVSRVLSEPVLADLLTTVPRPVVVQAVRRVLAEARAAARSGDDRTDAASVAEAAARLAREEARPSLRRAINATGIVLHTGLGRAVLPEAALSAVVEASRGHCLLEVDVETGRRGSRQRHCRALLAELTGAESALVVNNNAAALLLCLTALASGGEVILSRGEMVEIGGSFRLPDLVRASGATLVEVGTTNRTRLSDYASALSDRTRVLLKCHPSNFRVVGYAGSVSTQELAELGRNAGVLVLDDLGSGAMADTTALGAGPTVTLRQAVAAGADVVTASGDKLLGGPQAGIVLARAEWIDRVAAHPIARAVRCDKMTLAALEATLRLYRDPERAAAQVPTLACLARDAESLRAQAARIAEALSARLAGEADLDVVESRSQVGGGSLPDEELPTWCVALRPARGSGVDELAARLRRGEPAVFGRISEGRLLLDVRTVGEDEEAPLIAALSAAFGRASG